MMSVNLEDVRAWLVASCALQGVPVAITDIGVVSRVGVLLSGRGVAGLPRSGDRNPRRSQLPAGNDPVVVDAPRA